MLPGSPRSPLPVWIDGESGEQQLCWSSPKGDVQVGKSQDGSIVDGSPMETFLEGPALTGLRRRSLGLPEWCKPLLLGVQVKMDNIQIFQKEK